MCVQNYRVGAGWGWGWGGVGCGGVKAVYRRV